MQVNLLEIFTCIRIIGTFAILISATYTDIRKRIIPDSLPVIVALLSLLSPTGPHIFGLLVAILLLIVGVSFGGIGGGDIKLVAAVGLSLGFYTTLIGTVIAFALLIVFHAIRKIKKGNEEVNKAYPLAPFLLIGYMAGFLICL